jgi:hypothetical protein
MLPHWKKWKKPWKDSIKHNTPRVTQQQPDVDVPAVIELWSTKKKTGESQIEMIQVLPMFGQEIVESYKQCKESHNPADTIKSMDAAKAMRQIVRLNIKLLIGCDCEWDILDKNGTEPARAS